MTRCALLACATVGAALLASPAAAQMQRSFPASALRGELRFELAPEVSLNDKPARLAPGSRIRGADNMIKLSGSLSGQTHVVHYTLDPYGLLLDVWLLTDAERARKPWPASAAEAATWRFDAAAQRWSKP